MKGYARSSFVAFAGLVAGLSAGALWETPSRDNPERAVLDVHDEEGAPEPREATPGAMPNAASVARLEALERRVAALDRPNEAAATPAEAEAERQVEKLTPEESKQRHLDAHLAALQKHAAEPTDAAWAPGTASSLRADLDRMNEEVLNGAVLDVDCRTTSCVARVEWPSFADARERFSGVLRSDYEVNCAREITLPEPEDLQAPYVANVIFDCSESRGF